MTNFVSSTAGIAVNGKIVLLKGVREFNMPKSWDMKGFDNV